MSTPKRNPARPHKSGKPVTFQVCMLPTSGRRLKSGPEFVLVGESSGPRPPNVRRKDRDTRPTDKSQSLALRTRTPGKTYAYLYLNPLPARRQPDLRAAPRSG